MSHCVGWKFKVLIKGMERPTVLEIGTRRVISTSPTFHKEWVPHSAEYIGTDFATGLDVDVVADVCDRSSAFGEQRFDAIVSCSTFEHIQYPWVATVEICRTLKVGVLLFIVTHQTFPFHAHQRDYWRFTKEGLQTLFGAQAGFECIESGHEFRAPILSNQPGWVRRPAAPSFLNSTILVRKVAHPPANFRWRARSET
jgi:hypothetical protein